MKKKITMITLLGGFALLIAGAMFLSSCEGPAGADGADGTNGIDGANGTNGADGQDGQDANETCIICHDSEVVLFAKQQQTESSHHLEGGNYERSSASCSECHNHQGFTEKLATGTVAADIVDAAAINCRTCHMIHENYDDTDWALVTTDAVDTDFGDWTIDLGGNSNLCVNCHQFRAISPMPEMGGADVEITSSRWGPHHGPHANNLWGVGGYKIAGSKTYPEEGVSTHASAGCTACHMAPVPYGGRAAGGHTFNMTYEYHGSVEENIGACTSCHSTAETFDLAGVQTTIDGLVADLETIFIANGWMDEPGALWNTPITATADQAGAMLNYKIITEDRSRGIHNPAYMVALLTNSLESLQP